MKTMRKIRLRFSIRTLLIATACIAVVLGAYMLQVVVPWQRECRRIDMISKSSPNAQLFTEPRGQFWFRHFFGDDYSERLVYVHLDGPEVTDDWIESHLLQLKYVETLSIKSPNVTDAGLERLKVLPNLSTLSLLNTQVSQSGVTDIRTAKPMAIIEFGSQETDGTSVWANRSVK